MSDVNILVEDHGDVAVVRLNDDKTLNAATLAMADGLVAVLGDVSKTKRAIVLTGAGRGFCSGANLSGGLSRAKAEYDPGAALANHYNPLMKYLKSLPVPLVTAVNGAAAGIGAAIALSGDIVVASERAFFLQAFRSVGLVPDGASAFLLTRSAGRVRAMEMMLLGERVSAAKALEWGMINRVVAPDALDAEAIGLATQLAAGPTSVLGMIRKMCWDALEHGFEEQLDSECDIQRAASRTADHPEGVRAFLEKRPAVFTGR